MAQDTMSSPGTITPAMAGRSRNKFFQKKIVPWLFIAPIFLLHLFIVALPSLSAVYYSMTDWSGLGAAEFIGLENYRELLLDDKTFRIALGNNVTWLLIFITIPFILALVAASLLAAIKRGAMPIRASLFIPYILPSVITTTIWSNLLSPRLGVLKQLPEAIGLPGSDIALLGNTDTVLPTIAFIDNWHFWGFLMVLFLAAMQNIPPDLYDAAKIDGANRWHEFRHVTVPGIRPTLVLMLLMVSIWSFLVFDYVWILTQGGPAGASEVLGSHLYKQAFLRFEAGYASAIGLTMSMFALCMIGVFAFLRKRGWEI
ncbi:MAG: sugar ABC transporter permease [Chloroflexota bacterium]